MLVRAFTIFVLCFASFEASEEPDSRFLKTYTGDTNYNVRANNEGVKALMKDLILRQPIESVPETQTYRTSDLSRGNTSETDIKPAEHLQMWNEPGSLNYLIAKLEADTPRPKIHFNPVYDEFVKRNFHAASERPGFGGGFFKGHKMSPMAASRVAARQFLKRNFDPIDSSGFGDFYKRNFDPIDRSGFSDFNKRNFDPIDRSGFSDFYKRNFDPIDRSGFSDFNKRNFDPIDRSGFSDFYKRNFDTFDRSGFSDFNKRNFDTFDRSGFSDFNKRNFDTFDRSGFSDFNKRNFDPIDRSGFSDFLGKRSVPARVEENSSSPSGDHNS